MTSPGRRTALLTACMAVVVLGVAAFVARHRIAEEWYIRKLDSPDLSESYRAAWQLGELKSVRALPRLVELFKTCEDHKWETSKTSEDHNVADSFQVDQGTCFAVIFKKIGPPAEPFLVDILQNGTGYTRACSALSFDFAGACSHKTVLLLAEMASHGTDSDVRLACLYALISVKAKEPEAIAALEKGTKDESRLIRKVAENGLTELKAQ